MEKLIIIAIIVGASILHNWWTKRQQEDSEQADSTPDNPNRRPPPLPHPGQPGQPARGQNQPSGGWEEELRRLLQGEDPTPRPPIQRPQPPPQPMVKPRPAPVPAAPRPFLARSSIPVPDEGREMEVGLPVRPVSLDQASAAHDRASHLQASVIQRMRDTASRVSGHTTAGLTTVRPATHADRLGSLLRQKESQRTMIMASVILGPPRANEP